MERPRGGPRGRRYKEMWLLAAAKQRRQPHQTRAWIITVMSVSYLCPKCRTFHDYLDKCPKAALEQTQMRTWGATSERADSEEASEVAKFRLWRKSRGGSDQETGPTA